MNEAGEIFRPHFQENKLQTLVCVVLKFSYGTAGDGDDRNVIQGVLASP